MISTVSPGRLCRKSTHSAPALDRLAVAADDVDRRPRARRAPPASPRPRSRPRPPDPARMPSPLNSTAGSVSSCARPRTSSVDVARCAVRLAHRELDAAVAEQLVEHAAASRSPTSASPRRRSPRSCRRPRCPARAATDSGSTPATISFIACTPVANISQYARIANKKLNAGPRAAPRRAARPGADGTRGGAPPRPTGPSCSSSIFDVAAERDHRQPVLDVIGRPAAPRQQRPAEADREAQHFEPEPARAREVARTRAPRPARRSRR